MSTKCEISSVSLYVLAWSVAIIAFNVMFTDCITWQSSEAKCFATDTTHDRVAFCLESKRPGGECLQEARALCLKDLADKGGRHPKGLRP